MDDVKLYLSDLKNVIDQLDHEVIDDVIRVLHKARLNRRQVFTLGNGGSASTASHFVCDLGKNTRLEGWEPFRVFGLADNMAILTAYSNDEGYENAFAPQLDSLVNQNDVVIAISTSGNSENVVRAVDSASAKGATTIGFTGFDGGRLRQMVDYSVHVDSICIEHVEDVHLMLGHLITKSLRERLERMPWEERQAAVTAEVEASPNGAQEVLSRIGRELRSQPTLSSLLQRALTLTIESVGASSGSIMVLNEDGAVIEGAVAYAGKVQGHALPRLAETLHEGLAGWVVRTRSSALIADTFKDPRWMTRDWDSERKNSRSAISVPLLAGDRVVGVLTLTNADERRFTGADLALLTAIAVSISLSGSEILSTLPAIPEGQEAASKTSVPSRAN